jgi:hypothetical protein
LNHYYTVESTKFGYFTMTGIKGESVPIIQTSSETPTQTPVVVVQEQPQEPIASIEEEAITQDPEVTSDDQQYTPVKKSPFGLIFIFLLGAFVLSATLGTGIIFRKEIKDILFAQKQANVQLLEDVQEKKILLLADKTQIRNLHDLAWALENISDEVFIRHVAPGRNDFSLWVKEALGDEQLSQYMASGNRQEMLHSINERIQVVDVQLKKEYFKMKYGIEPTQFESTMQVVRSWKKDGVTFPEMDKRLKMRKFSQEAIDDLIYGTVDEAEDFVIHPDDEASINIFLFDSFTQGTSLEEVRRKLLEQGWSRCVVEKKLKERFKK